MIRRICPDDHELLPLASDGSADRSISDHVAGCPACRGRLDRMSAEVRSLRRGHDGTASQPWSALGPTPGASDGGDAGLTRDWTPPDPAVSTAADPGGDAAPPAAIGKYLVVGELDRGGQAVVYRVVHPGLGRDLALKYAREPLADGDPARGLIAAEARALAAVPDHPGLVRVHDLDLHDGHLYLVMDFVRGRTLDQYARDHRPDPRRCAALVAEAARAVAAAHRCGVVHQDVKPKNVLVDDTGRVRLIDFGMARFRHAWSDADDGPSGGTPQFMPPEQARGEAEKVGPRTDVFALGAVLYFLLTGRPPFPGRTPTESWSLASRCDFDRAALRAPKIPGRLARAVLHAMAPDPADRHPSAEALAGELESFLRRPARVAAQAGVLLLAATAAAVWSLWPRPVLMPVAAAAVPLRVESFRVELHRRDPAGPLGAIGETAFAGQFRNDDVRVKARLSAPGYSYLIALNPDGTVQLCLPASPAAAPSKTADIDFPPDPAVGFGLTDGVGLQAFVLVASRDPLPPFAEWRRGVGELSCTAAGSGVVWRYDGRSFEPEDGRPASDLPRGDLRRLADVPPPLDAACRALQARPGVEAIRALAFPVVPRPAPNAREVPAPGASTPSAGSRPDKIIAAGTWGVLPVERISNGRRDSGFVRGNRPHGVPGLRLTQPAIPDPRRAGPGLASFGDGAAAVRSPPGDGGNSAKYHWLRFAAGSIVGMFIPKDLSHRWLRFVAAPRTIDWLV